jgi:hypothetical protein
MNGLRRLIGKPFRGFVNVSATVRNQGVNVRRLDRGCHDRQTASGIGNTFRNRGYNCVDHIEGHPHRGMFHPFLGHATTHRISRMERVWLGESDLVIPRFRPRAAIIAGKPKPITRFHIVVSERIAHRRIVIPL